MATRKSSSRGRAESRADRFLAEGVGGLRFEATAPPGLGRLVRIPFYYGWDSSLVGGFHALSEDLLVANLTETGSTRSDRHPIIAFRAPAAATVAVDTATPFLSGEPLLRTPRVRWATLRVVGFEVVVYRQLALVRDACMELCVRELQLGGGSSLFSHDDYAPGSIYLAGQESFAGLRDYPILKTTNQAQVFVQYTGTCTTLDGGGGADIPLVLFSMFSAHLVCDVLYDDDHGAHVPGSYARKGALVREGGRKNS